jgi:hypothetical protein
MLFYNYTHRWLCLSAMAEIGANAIPLAFNPLIHLLKSSKLTGMGRAIATENLFCLTMFSSSLSLFLIYFFDGTLSIKLLLKALGS